MATFTVRDDLTGITATTAEYDPKISAEINGKIRNLPIVKKYCNDIAQLTAGRAGPGFIVVKAGGKARYRAYIAPDTNEAMKAELKDGVLLKAALSMAGK